MPSKKAFQKILRPAWDTRFFVTKPQLSHPRGTYFRL